MELKLRVPAKLLKFDTKKLTRKLEAGRNKALDRVGSIVRRSAQKQLSSRKRLSKPVWNRVGDIDGVPLVSMSFQKSTPGKVTSWKPKRFLYSRILYARDDRKGSVVIGPDDKVTKVNTLQEFGGSREIKLVLVRPVPVANLFQYKVPRSMVAGRRDSRGRFQRQAAYVGMWRSTGSRVKGRVVRRDPGRAPAGRYMERGLAAKRQAILPQFKDQISGP